VSGNVFFKSRFTNDISVAGTTVLLAPAPGYHTFNLKASYAIDDWVVSAYVNNLGNRKYIVAEAIFTGASYYSAVPAEPRTFEVSVSKKF